MGDEYAYLTLDEMVQLGELVTTWAAFYDEMQDLHKYVGRIGQLTVQASREEDECCLSIYHIRVSVGQHVVGSMQYDDFLVEKQGAKYLGDLYVLRSFYQSLRQNTDHLEPPQPVSIAREDALAVVYALLRGNSKRDECS